MARRYVRNKYRSRYRRRCRYGFSGSYRRPRVYRNGYMPARTVCRYGSCKKLRARKCLTTSNWVKDYDGDYIMRSLADYSKEERAGVREQAAQNVAKARLDKLAAKVASGVPLSAPVFSGGVKRARTEGTQDSVAIIESL